MSPRTFGSFASRSVKPLDLMPDRLFVSVALPLPVDHTFTYLVPSEYQATAVPGARVLVPFRGKQTSGVIVARTSEYTGSARVRPIIEVLDDEPSLTAELLELTRWISDYYVCGWGEAIRAVLPPGTDVRSRTIVRLLSRPDDITGEERPLFDFLAEREEVSLASLRQQVGGISLSRLRQFEDAGVLILTTEVADARVAPRVEQHLRFSAPFRDPDEAVDIVETLRGEKQQAVLRIMLEHLRRGKEEVRRSDVTAAADAAASTITSLVNHGIVEIVEREVFRSPLESVETELPPIQLHQAQQAALDKIVGAIESGKHQTFLLHGITGSGKTEVYIEALRNVRDRGKTAIVLVPEIALTPQTVRRFRSRFGDEVAVLHSRMSLGERFDSWRRIRAGEFSIVIGPRSAVMAPLENIGLIVVDEEHEGSYKQFEPDPRYHARDVAVMRSHMAGAVCILGSATPSLESLMNARGGKYELLEMMERVPLAEGVATLPNLRVVDLAKEKKRHQLKGAISDDLRDAIQQRLDRKEQVILLQNRRGYAPLIECDSCGWAPECVDCAVTLTYHKQKSQLRCHYCGRAWRVPRTCPSCDEDALQQLGAGTQRVEEEVAKVFPDARIMRMDLDTTSRKNAHHEMLSAFGRGEVDILLGTQMIAKGLDFPRVTLVGIINADGGMRLPDFRAEERTFQLIMQVAGRAGRADLAGEVILQTRNPEHPVVTRALEHDYNGFAEWTLQQRREHGYPPYARLAAVEFKGLDERDVSTAASRWAAALQQNADGVQILGPEPAFIERIKKMYRYQLIVKASKSLGGNTVQQMLRKTRDQFGQMPRGVRLTIDIDPVGLL